jgi:hypothetical protein
MPFADELRPPPALRTRESLLRPIRTDDATLDHEAVMASKEMVRIWEQTGWPADGLTIDQNREDLRRLVARHNDGSAFTYTVLVPDESLCLGCVYIFPTDFGTYTRASITPLQEGIDWDAHDVAVGGLEGIEQPRRRDESLASAPTAGGGCDDPGGPL